MAVSPVLHYIHDPLCGWCYGAAPLLAAASPLDGLRIVLHAGGLFTGSNRQPVSEGLRQHVLPQDRRIAELSGQAFGSAYFDGLLRDIGAVLDSAPPSAAILAAEALAGQGLAMLQAVQLAHYQHGRRIADPAVLQELAEQLGLPAAAFAAALQQQEGAALAAHIGASRRLLAQLGGSGFPTLALERDGRYQLLEVGRYFGRPEAFRALLAQAPNGATPTVERTCNPAAADRC